MRIFDEEGVLLEQTDPRAWSELRDDPVGQPMRAFWGGRTAGPGASFFFADVTSFFSLARRGVANEPTVTVSPAP